MLIAAVGLFSLALARPQFGTKMELVKRKGVDIFIAMDVSASMLAEDPKPNRLERAKMEVRDLIDRLEGDRVGLIAFAGTPFVQCPLTTDYGAAKMFLDLMGPDLIPQPGTAIGEAIRMATASFEQEERKHKVLVLVTDGEDHETQPVEAAKEAAAEGVVIYAIGIGSAGGAPVPEVDERGVVTGIKKDRNGNLVMSKLGADTLRKVALMTNGKYHQASAAGMELERIYEDISQMEKKELQARKFTQYEEQFQWLVLAGVLLMVWEWGMSERRKPRG